MGPQNPGNERTRAWVLARAAPAQAQDVAEVLYQELGHEGGDDFVVVRADVVDYDYNIVVPVDAVNEEMLRYVVGSIKEQSGVLEVVLLRVERHTPLPPHDAHGYITDQEAEAGKDPTIVPGRQGASPGHNAFG